MWSHLDDYRANKTAATVALACKRPTATRPAARLHGLHDNTAANPPSLPPFQPQDASYLPYGSVMIIDPDDDTFRQDFDAWSSRPDILDSVFSVTTRFFEVDHPLLWTLLLHAHDRRKALHDRRHSCLNWGKTGHFVQHCKEPFPKVNQLSSWAS